MLTNGGWIHKEPVKETELIETAFEDFNKVLADLFLAYADTSFSENEFDQRLNWFAETVKRRRAEFFEQFKQHHLEWAVNDPLYDGDAYRKLPEGAETMVGFMRVGYSFWQIMGDSVTSDHAYGARLLPKKMGRAKRRLAD